MAIPGGIEIVLSAAFFLLLVLALPAGYVLKWFREGYERGKRDDADRTVSTK